MELCWLWYAIVQSWKTDDELNFVGNLLGFFIRQSWHYNTLVTWHIVHTYLLMSETHTLNILPLWFLGNVYFFSGLLYSFYYSVNSINAQSYVEYCKVVCMYVWCMKWAFLQSSDGVNVVFSVCSCVHAGNTILVNVFNSVRYCGSVQDRCSQWTHAASSGSWGGLHGWGGGVIHTVAAETIHKFSYPLKWNLFVMVELTGWNGSDGVR